MQYGWTAGTPIKRGKKKYLVVNLGGKMYKVHRLVASAFLGRPDRVDQTQVNHLNGVTTFNNIKNLEWASPQENIKHAYETGLLSTKPIPVTQFTRQGNKVAEYKSIAQAAATYCETNPQKTVSNAVKRISHACSSDSHIGYKYLWYRTNDI